MADTGLPEKISSQKPYDKYKAFGAFHWGLLDTDKLYRARVDAVARLVEPGFACLDLGCGDAAYFKVLAKLCAKIVGVDADPEGIRLGREMLEKQEIGNGVLHCSPFSSARDVLGAKRFDLVYSMDCIEHLEDPRELVDLMYETLTPTGKAVVGTPLFCGKDQVSPYHVTEFTIEDLRSLLESKFRVLDVLRLPDFGHKKTMFEDRFAILTLGRK